MSAYGQFLSKSSTGALLDRMLADNAAIDQKAEEDAKIAKINEAIVVDHVRTKFLESRRQQFVIRRKAEGLYYRGHGAGGPRWCGDQEHAERFEFVTIATATILFRLDEAIEDFEIVTVER